MNKEFGLAKIKKLFLPIFLFAACSVIFAQESMDKRVAIVNLVKPEIISRKQLDQTISVLKANGISKSEQEVLEAMIEDSLLKQGSEKEGIKISDTEIISALRKETGPSGRNATDEQLKEFIEERLKISWDTYLQKSRETLAVQKYIRKVKSSKLSNIESPSKAEIKRFYDENSKQFFIPKTMTIDHIFADTRSLNEGDKSKAFKKISDFSKQLKKSPGDFEKLVEFSDDSASKYNKGRFGSLRIDDAARRKFMGDNFFDSVFALKKGEISSVITSNVGYHIIRVEEIFEPRLLGLNEKMSSSGNVTVEDAIVQYLTAQKYEMVFRECVKELTQELKKKADIKYFL